MSPDEYSQLKAKIERLKQRRAEAEGAFKAALKRLEDQWQVDTLKAAKARLAKLEEERAALEEQLQARLKAFDKKWNHLLKS